MTIIDLTLTFSSDLPVYPGDSQPHLEAIFDFEHDGIRNVKLTTSMHVGTHIDGPRHMLAEGPMMSDIPVERFAGRGVHVLAEGKKVLDADLLEGVELKIGDIVVIESGHTKELMKPRYFSECPQLTEAFAQKLADAHIAMVGIDFPSPDGPPFKIHKLLLANGILIIENLTNLHAMREHKNFTIAALPLKIKADSGLARVVAIAN